MARLAPSGFVAEANREPEEVDASAKRIVRRKRPHVVLTLSPAELSDLDSLAAGRTDGNRSRMVAELVREESWRQARRAAPKLPASAEEKKP